MLYADDDVDVSPAVDLVAGANWVGRRQLGHFLTVSQKYQTSLLSTLLKRYRFSGSIERISGPTAIRPPDDNEVKLGQIELKWGKIESIDYLGS